MNNQNSKGMMWIACRSIFSILTIITLIMLIGFFLFNWFQHPLDSEGIYSNYGGVGIEKLRIGLALILASVFFWFPNNLSRKIKAIPLLWILAEYILWWISSYSLFVGANEQIIEKLPRLFLLYNATWWDIIILIVTLLSLICLLTTIDRKT